MNLPRSPRRTLLKLLLGLNILFIGTSVPVLALFNDGGFESGNLGSWTQSNYINTGLSLPQPFTEGSIDRTVQLNPDTLLGPNILTSVVGSSSGGAMSIADPVVNQGLTDDADLNPSPPPALMVPRFGNYATRINANGATTGFGTGRDYNASTLKQTTTVTTDDIDPVDGLIHIRFTFAPVLEFPDHPNQQQPYFYVGVKNNTKSTLLYEKFNFAGQAGIPWKTITIRDPLQTNYDPIGQTTWQYTDWQIVDIAPGNTGISVGDEIELEVIAAGCAVGGHGAYVYVDAFGSMLPGLTVAASAAASVYAGDQLTYDITYRNTDSLGYNSSIVKFNVPPQTTFASVSNTTACSESSGLVTCNFGTMAANTSGTFQVVVNVLPGASGTVTAGNYSIEGTLSTGGAYPALFGPVVNTSVLTRPDDLAISQTYEVTNVSKLTLHITIKNNGSAPVSGAILSDTFPNIAPSSSWNWTCAGVNGTSDTACGALSGTGNLSHTLGTLPGGGSVNFTVEGSLLNWSYWENTATIAGPVGFLDTVSTNNASLVGRYQILLMIIFR